jgi:SAM-dependent methyltransferase
MGSASVQSSLWGARARDWQELQEPMGRPLWYEVLRNIGAGPGVRILDAGCGSGGASIEAVRLGAVPTGVDASGALVELARARLPSFRFDEADLEELPYSDGSFDAVMAINSVFYAADMAHAMSELVRVTRPGGRIAVTAWGSAEKCENRDVFAAVSALVPPPPGRGGPFALAAPGALEQVLSRADTRVIASGEARCDFYSPDAATCWRGQSSAGPLQNAIRVVGEEKVKAAVEATFPAHTDDRGAVLFRNVFIWAVGERT